MKKHFVPPASAQEIIDTLGISKKNQKVARIAIELSKVPRDYPADLRFCIETGKMTYEETKKTVDYELWWREKWWGRHGKK